MTESKGFVSPDKDGSINRDTILSQVGPVDMGVIVVADGTELDYAIRIDTRNKSVVVGKRENGSFVINGTEVVTETIYYDTIEIYNAET